MSYPSSKPGANPTSSKGPQKAMGSQGDGTQRKADKVFKELQEDRRQVDGHGVGWEALGGPTFPAAYTPDDTEKDTRMKLKTGLIGDGGASPFGLVTATDKDFDYILEKKKLQEKLYFDVWYSRLFDTTDINKLRLAQQIYPDFYKDREAYIDKVADLQKRIALIKLRGPADLDDLKLIYLIRTQNIELPDQPLHMLNEAPTNREGYQRGIFNPARFTSQDAAIGRIPNRQGVNILNAPSVPALAGIDTTRANNLGQVAYPAADRVRDFLA